MGITPYPTTLTELRMRKYFKLIHLGIFVQDFCLRAEKPVLFFAEYEWDSMYEIQAVNHSR